MKAMRWVTYPLSQPEESGLYVVNFKTLNVYMTVLSFFDKNTKKWYDSNDREKLIEGINAFNPFKITYYVHP